MLHDNQTSTALHLQLDLTSSMRRLPKQVPRVSSRLIDNSHCKAQLPADADTDHITAEIENGELIVRVPREQAQQASGHTVEVQ